MYKGFAHLFDTSLRYKVQRRQFKFVSLLCIGPAIAIAKYFLILFGNLNELVIVKSLRFHSLKSRAVTAMD